MDKVNVDMCTPDWLTKEFLEKLLKDNHDSPVDNIEIIKFEVRNALGKGSNYLSSILRIPIEYKIVSSSSKVNDIQATSLIVKVELDNNDGYSAIKNAGVIEKEYLFYTEMLPKMNDIIQQDIINFEIAPKYFKCDIENVLILEDLTFAGYKMEDRKEQLDYEHAVVVLKCLAKFHAASVKLHESEPELVEKIGTDLIYVKTGDEELRKLLTTTLGEAQLERVCQEFEKWQELKKFVPFLTKLKPKVWDLLVDSMQPDADEFVVLNHGDFWTNNFLFKHDNNGKPLIVKILDFQILNYSTPVTDLLFFFHTSIRYEVLKTNFQDFVQIYYHDLNSNLARYGSSKRLHLEDFRRSLEKRELYSLIRCVTFLPIIFRDENEVYNDSEEPKTLEDSVTSSIQNKQFRTVCAKYLEDFSKTSWFQNFK